MKPIMPNKSNKEFEKVAVDEWLNGEIVEISERTNDKKKIKDKESGEFKTVTMDEIRFVFSFENYQFKHYSRWMNRSVNKESNLFKNFLRKICPQLQPETAIDLDKFVGVKVKVMWENNEYNGETYQNVAQIRPLVEVAPEEVMLKIAEEVF